MTGWSDAIAVAVWVGVCWLWNLALYMVERPDEGD